MQVARDFMDFFAEESCGYCVPCRVGNVLLREGLERILAGRGEPEDLTHFRSIGALMKKTSRCGLGQTSPNPILTTIKNFRALYEAKMTEQKPGMQPTFDIHAALREGQELTGRKSVIFNE